ncbi:MAG: patatin-like phospholipase family protein [Actinomycetota bacterium]|jgi:NTE family protein|nr:patatin-like phospholipase family protein [Actinomycetota bacterium]
MSLFKRKRKVGLALSSGSARGIAHIGVLKELEKLGVKPHAISGTSMGAIIGALYCSGVTPDEMETFAKSIKWKSFMLFSDFVLSDTGIINGHRVEELLKKFLGNKTFSDCQIPFCCVAVDLARREKVILREGKLIDAVRASISIPGFFSAVHLDNRILVDGGLMEPLPVGALRTMDTNFIIASSITFKKDMEKYMNYLSGQEGYENNDKGVSLRESKDTANEQAGKITKVIKKTGRKKFYTEKLSVRKIIDTSFTIVQEELHKNYIKYADIIIESEVGDFFGLLDLKQSSEIIQRGRQATIEKTPEIKRKLGL